MTTPEAYFDEIAEFYEAVNPIDHDIGFWVEEAQKADGPVLEIGCGTGRVYLDLLRAGVNAYGIDISQGMLSELREKAEADSLNPQVSKADMRTFSLDRSFGLIIVPLRTFMNATTKQDQLQTLARIREHLKPDGKAIINFTTPGPETLSESYGVEREHPIQINGEEYTQVTKTEFVDRVDEITRAERRLYDENDDLVVKTAQQAKLIHKREFVLLLDATGYTDSVPHKAG